MNNKDDMYPFSLLKWKNSDVLDNLEPQNKGFLTTGTTYLGCSVFLIAGKL